MSKDMEAFKKWRRLAQKFNFLCLYCGADLLKNHQTFAAIGVENFKPKTATGKTVFPTCAFCAKIRRGRKFSDLTKTRWKILELKKAYLKKYQFAELRKKYRKK